MATPVKVDVLFDAKGLLTKSILALGSAFAASKVLELAKEQEEAIERMNTQLKLTGDFSEEASKDMQNFASSLQASSTFGDEVILNQIALAKSFGATNEQAKLIAKTAADLSVSMGISLESATEQVSKTLGGFSGRLGQAIPKLKELSKEALISGEGVKLLAERFDGAAKGQIKTFGGAMTQLKNTFGDTLEEIGFLIVDNPVIVEIINIVNEALASIGSFIKSNRDSIINFTNQIIQGFLKFVSVALKVFSKFFKVLGFFRKIWAGTINAGLKNLELFINAIITKFPIIGKVVLRFVNNLRKGFLHIKDYLINLGSTIVEFASKNSIISGALKATGLNVDSLADSLERMKKQNLDQIKGFKELNQESVNLGRAVSGSFGLFGDFQNFVGDALIGIGEFAERADKNIVKVRRRLGTVGEKGKRKVKANGEEKKEGDSVSILGVNFNTKDLASNVVKGVGQGFEGAKSVISGMAGKFAEKFLSFLGPIGSVFGEIFNLFSQTPEQFREQVTAFVEAIPQIILNVVENLADLGMILTDALINAIDSFIERLPSVANKLIQSLVTGAPRIITKLVQQTPRLINSFIQQIPNIAGAFITEMVKGAPKVIEELIKSLNPFGGDGGLLGGIPIVGDVFGGIGDVFGGFGFAKGGLIPEGFPGDTFPARLTSGEYVIDRNTTKDLQEYLKNPQQNNNENLLQAILFQVQQPIRVESNLNLDNRTFGQIILELSRDNQRLGA